MIRFLRLLVFLGYAGAAFGIFYGFLYMDWREPTPNSSITIGREFVQLAVDDLRTALMLEGAELSVGLLRNTSAEVRTILEARWPAVAVFYVLFLVVTYAIQALGAFVLVLVGRHFYPHGALGRFFALIGMAMTIIFALVLPLFILQRFYQAYLSEQVVAAGFWVTVGAVILGASTSLLIEFARYFIPHPLDQPRAPRRRRAQEDAFDDVPAGYFDDGQPPIYDPYSAGSVSQQDAIDNVFGKRGNSGGKQPPKR